MYNTSHDCIHVFFLTAGNSVTNHCMQSKKPPSAAKATGRSFYSLISNAYFTSHSTRARIKHKSDKRFRQTRTLGLTGSFSARRSRSTLGHDGSSACDVQCGSTYSIAGDNKMAQRLQQRIKLVDISSNSLTCSSLM